MRDGWTKVIQEAQIMGTAQQKYTQFCENTHSIVNQYVWVFARIHFWDSLALLAVRPY
jgi:hypothetical protein